MDDFSAYKRKDERRTSQTRTKLKNTSVGGYE
jgi:hypothetical protein